MTFSFNKAALKIRLTSQYHLGSGFGLARIIDALLKVDGDGVPVIPGSTVSGIAGQGLYDLLNYSCFDSEWSRVCRYHSGDGAEPRLPCGVLPQRSADPCLLCYFLGSTADDGIVNWMDFQCVTDPDLLRPLLRGGQYSREERKQYIRPYASHKQDGRTGTVKGKHFFVQEEGAALTFEGEITFKSSAPEERIWVLAAALANVRAVGRRKSRGKGECTITGIFVDENGSCMDMKTLIEGHLK